MKSLSPLLLSGLLIAHTAFSHELEDSQKPLVTTGLSVALSYSYRNKNYNDNDSEWQVPGTLMGGEALPVEEDAALDDATADYQYAFSPNAGFQITAEAHGGHGETEFKFAHYWYLQQWHIDDATVRLEAGQMAAAFSPQANWHASLDEYSEASLTSDILWGRSFVDRGIRSTYTRGNWLAGAEIWQGRSWLADNGKAGDVFLRYGDKLGDLSYTVGSWLFAAEADQRRDIRYFGGHSHGNVVVTSNDASFTGDVAAYGLDTVAELPLKTAGTVRLSASVTQLEQDGEVIESQRSAALESDYLAWIVGVNWRFQQHELAARHEVLNLDNTLTGPAAVLVGRNTSLDNPSGQDPERSTVSYRFHYNEHLTLRIEWVDETLGELEQERGVIGIVLRKIFQ